MAEQLPTEGSRGSHSTNPYEGTVNAPDASLAASRRPRAWFGIVLVAAYWAFTQALPYFDLPIYLIFFSTVGASALLLLAFLIWWLANRRISSSLRLTGLAAAIFGGVTAAIASDPSVGPMGVIFVGLPMAFTAWAIWFAISRGLSLPVQRAGLVCVLAAAWSALMLVRVNGIDGDNRASVSWRYTPTAEEAYLSSRASESKDSQADPAGQAALELAEGDWPEFRGPLRRGEVHKVQIATDWDNSPPKLIWRERIGPAWSSVIIIGNRLYTQEQRGESEATVCLDTGTGKEIWSHEDKVRYSDGQAGAGPRATPSFSGGKIYALGATGILNCLDARTGKLNWTRNLVADTGAPLPMWGFSSSPLVMEGVVIVFAGGKEDQGLVAYDAQTGEPAWHAATGPTSYSSPQPVTLGGKSLVLFLSDAGLLAVKASTGEQLWKYEAEGNGVWRVVQPRQFEASAFLIGSEDLGLVRLDVGYDDKYSVTETYSTRALRPAFNDFVLSDGFAYGFDEAIFACVDIVTGKRKWKAGRYGHGQALLLADQPLLLVLSETGEIVLVAATSKKHEELGRFQAITGKSWAMPVIAHGRLFVRNDQEIACFELKLEQP